MPVYDPGTGTGRMLALDLDPSRGDVGRQAAGLVRLLERLGARHVADVSPSGGRHVYVPFAVSLPWRELRDVGQVCRGWGAVLCRPAAGAPPGIHRPSRQRC